MCTGIGDISVYVCACVVVRILRSNATARHHICRNIRLAHMREIRFIVAARMQVPRVILAHRRESHTARNLQIFSRFFLRYSICECVRLPRSHVQNVTTCVAMCGEFYAFECNECGSPGTCNRNFLFICAVGILNTC